MRLLLIPLLFSLSACNTLNGDLLQDDHCLKIVDYEVNFNMMALRQEGYLRVHKECLPKAQEKIDATVSEPTEN